MKSLELSISSLSLSFSLSFRSVGLLALLFSATRMDSRNCSMTTMNLNVTVTFYSIYYMLKVQYAKALVTCFGLCVSSRSNAFNDADWVVVVPTVLPSNYGITAGKKRFHSRSCIIIVVFTTTEQNRFFRDVSCLMKQNVNGNIRARSRQFVFKRVDGLT